MFGWLKGRRETRARGRDYTDLRLEARYLAAMNWFRSDALAAFEAGVGLIVRAFACADVSPAILRGTDLAPHVRRMLRRGESAAQFWVEPDGRLGQYFAASFDVDGADLDPMNGWEYALDLAAPGGQSTRKLRGREVLHFRYAETPEAPWRSVGPLGIAAATSSIAAAVERAIKDDSAIKTTWIVPLPYPNVRRPSQTADYIMEGGLIFPNTTAGGWGSPSDAPRKDYGVTKLAPDPSGQLLTLRRQLAVEILGALGVSPVLVGLDGAGEKDSREAYRRFAHTTCKGLGEIMAAELARKVGGEVKITFDALMASDMAARARAFKGFVDGGMNEDHAAALVGAREE